MTDLPPDLAPATVVVAAGRPPRSARCTGQRPPIELSSTYAAHPAIRPRRGGPEPRLRPGHRTPPGRPSKRPSGPSKAVDALCFASGMAAISAALTVLPADRPAGCSPDALQHLRRAHRGGGGRGPRGPPGRRRGHRTRSSRRCDGARRDLARVADQPAHAGRRPAGHHRRSRCARGRRRRRQHLRHSPAAATAGPRRRHRRPLGDEVPLRALRPAARGHGHPRGHSRR
jgi:hypothetical protein